MRNLKEAFGLKVREFRKMRGFTQEELAEMIEINPRQLARIEKGENFASAETMARLSMSLNVTLASFFDFDWNHEITLMATGTDNVPVLRLVQKDEKVKILATQNQFDVMDIPKQVDVSSTEEVMKKISQKMKKPITVEYFNDKTRKYIKTYHPSGRIEVNISEKAIKADDIQNYVRDKMKSYSAQVEKLEFIKLAVDSISDRSALEELKILIRGIELAQSYNK